MRLRWLRPVLAAFGLACLPHQGTAAEPATISNDAIIHYDVQPDGAYVRTLHLERRAGTDAEARSLSIFPWQYNAAREQVDIVSAYTRKSDGSRLAVDPATIRDQPVGGAGSTPSIAGQREKLITFPGVTAGDTIVLNARDRLTRPRLPNVFSLGLLFDRTQLWDARITVSVPGSMTLDADAVGPVASITSDGAAVTYAWDYHTTTFKPIDIGMLAPIGRLPRLLVTTATWEQIGRDYARLVLPQAAVTNQVNDVADVATHGVTDHRAMAQRLYDWVRRNVTYVPVPLGEANIVPRTADATLDSKQGDSADIAVLLSALLQSEGIPSRLALIPIDNLFRLEIPVPSAQLGHALLFLPEFGLYADPTAGTVPFGQLPFDDYGKPAIYAAAKGTVEGSIPVLAPGFASTTVTTTAHLTADDMVAGDTTIAATGPFASTLRNTGATVARSIAAAAPEAVGDSLLASLGERGTARFDPPPADSNAEPYTLSGHFAVSVWPLLSADNHLTMPVGLQPLPQPGDFLLGPLNVPNLPESEPTTCFAGTQIATTTLDLGTKFVVTHLPPDRSIRHDAFSYTSHWSRQGQAVTVRRELVSRIAAPICDGKLREQTAAALREIRQDYDESVALAPAPAPASAAAAPPPISASTPPPTSASAAPPPTSSSAAPPPPTSSSAAPPAPISTSPPAPAPAK